MNMPTTKDKFDDLKSVISYRDSVYMLYWQNQINTPKTLEEFHACGNRACIAGHLALSPLFQRHGGEVCWSGTPALSGTVGANAVELWFFGNDDASEKTNLVIHGYSEPYYVSNWGNWKSKEAVAALELLENQHKYSSSEFYELLCDLYSV